MVKAVCNVAPMGKKCDGSAESGEVRGTVSFDQPVEGGETTITYRVTGLAPGSHGFHVHEKADFSEGCKR